MINSFFHQVQRLFVHHFRELIFREFSLLRTVPDARHIREWLDRDIDRTGSISFTGVDTISKPKHAVVIGGGFIGLEMVENLIERGLEVTLIEKLNQVMPPLDTEMARLVERYLMKHGVKIELSDGVAGFRKSGKGALEVLTESGKVHPADIVIMAIGVKPELSLAKMAGIEIGKLGGMRVDDQMRTSDPDIFAVGDAVEVKNFVTRQWALIPLAGPANRQGRIVADVIAGRNSRFRGTQGTSICKLFDAAIAQTGVSEKQLIALGDNDYEKIYLYPEFTCRLLSRSKNTARKTHIPKIERTGSWSAGYGRRWCAKTN